jgi:dipeptidyl aminopeptidase/acylaminoacyl peptidase
LKSWVFGKPGDVRPEDLITPLDAEVPTFDGRKIPAFLYLPPGSHEMLSGRTPAVKHPVLIFVHGGPEAQYRPAFSPLLEYLICEMRIAVIAPNVRGSTGYGKTFASLDNGKLREDSVKDIGALLDWIAGNKFLDASRVAILGSSYGGYMVLASMIRYGARIQAGIDVAGIGDFTAFLAGTTPHRRGFRRAEYGDVEDPGMSKFLERISPAARLQEIRSPLLVIHGANDPRVPLSEAENVVAKARKSGRPVWAVYAQGEGHGFSRHESTDYQDAAIVLFLKAYLPPGSPPAR